MIYANGDLYEGEWLADLKRIYNIFLSIIIDGRGRYSYA